jgi:hypothetical protein
MKLFLRVRSTKGFLPCRGMHGCRCTNAHVVHMPAFQVSTCTNVVFYLRVPVSPRACIPDSHHKLQHYLHLVSLRSLTGSLCTLASSTWTFSLVPCNHGRWFTVHSLAQVDTPFFPAHAAYRVHCLFTGAACFVSARHRLDNSSRARFHPLQPSQIATGRL